MFRKIAAFELRYQFGSPVFWVVAALFFLLTFGSVASEHIQIGAGGNVHANSPFAIVQVHAIFSLFFMFVTTAFVANVVVRDDESGFGPMVRTTRVTRFQYLLGRFTGAFLAAAVAFLAIPLAIWVGSLMPWIDPERLGPTMPAAFAWAYFVVALPNLFLTAAIFFAVATVTRSMMGSYVGVIVFLVLYAVMSTMIGRQPEWRHVAGYVEPFGVAAISNATRYFTAAERNAILPPLDGALLANRLIWIGVALAALAFAVWRFRFAERGISRRRLRKQARREAKLGQTAPRLVDRLPAPQPDGAAWSRLLTRCRFEMAQVFRSPAFAVLLVVGLFNTVGALIFAGEIYGTPARPLTFALIETLTGGFGLIPIIIAIYYAGELVWRDRDRKIHEIIDATPLPNWAYMVPKALAVTGVLFTTLLVAAVAAILVQLIRGGGEVSLGEYWRWYLLPQTVDMVLLAILSVFVQALSPNKYVGWAIMVVYIVATLTLSNLGYEHPLYLYGGGPTPQLSDMNGAQVGGAAAWWVRLYWGAAAVILATLAHLLWRRGTETRLLPRLRRVPARLRGVPGVIIGVALVAFVGIGAFIFYNTNVLNEYRTRDANEQRMADYEKKYLRYENVVQPSLTAVRLAIDLHPSERRMAVDGLYRFVNASGRPIETLHVRLPDADTRLASVTVPGARLVADDAAFQYRLYRFDRPLAPGATGTLQFRTERTQRGFRASGEDTRLVANGSFLNNFEFAPQLGMSREGLLTDRVTRRRYGLPSELRMAKLEDVSARQRNYLANVDWVNSDITVTTDAPQVPIAPGRRVSDTTQGGRRTAHFVSTAPILAFFSVQSADYAVRRDRFGPVQLEVYYQPNHGFNVDRMLQAMKLSLGYYDRAFGPYQFDYARIIEFPGYDSFAQAFAGTVPYSEKIGFIADTRDPDEIDYVTYVTAHELGHQYWAHQLISADQQGGTVLVETMAQYSALMVMKHLYGEDKIRRFLKYELDNYLRSRGGEAIEELPLDRVENQGYIHYRKGAVVLYLLQDRLGEERVNAMLRGLLARHRFEGAPYANSMELVDGFRGLARNAGERQLVDDLFDRITLYDLKAKAAKTRKLSDGRYETVLTIEGGKAYADGRGKETQAALDDQVDVGLFTARPGLGSFDRADVLVMERRPIRSGTQALRLVTAKRPAFAGVDPYNKYIDRNSDDNVVQVD
ncbi:ABC transporter permease/M1 family aminopeptidase [Sphingomonas desiccabilis]|uniref:Aminopeptidase n=1 Tax=Sphingomonas desiccabilis TaxID=429134 RepID=A0A4Q2IQL5_9SPHN|nr:M1 family aminopeptidase [Sphingomonas desiccabilis]MBB3912232.1 aminopeptidase N [Sphingomonas desiccabilis]RXZ30387.1 aminopeptidase [Sphingomonas desiccabilis]